MYRKLSIYTWYTCENKIFEYLNIDDLRLRLESMLYRRTLVSIFHGSSIIQIKIVCTPIILHIVHGCILVIQLYLDGGRCSIFLKLSPRNPPLSTSSCASDASCEIFRKRTARVIGPEVVKTRFATAHNTIIFNTNLLANDDAKTR